MYFSDLLGSLVVYYLLVYLYRNLPQSIAGSQRITDIIIELWIHNQLSICVAAVCDEQILH